jgi:hypothetical protein
VFNEANWAATIGDIATFTYHYEETLMQIALARRGATVPERVLAEAAA